MKINLKKISFKQADSFLLEERRRERMAISLQNMLHQRIPTVTLVKIFVIFFSFCFFYSSSSSSSFFYFILSSSSSHGYQDTNDPRYKWFSCLWQNKRIEIEELPYPDWRGQVDLKIYGPTAESRGVVRATFNFPGYICRKTNPFSSSWQPRRPLSPLEFPAAGPAGVGVRNNSSRRSWARHGRIARTAFIVLLQSESTPYSLLTLYGRHTCPLADRTFPITRSFFSPSLSLSSIYLYESTKPPVYTTCMHTHNRRHSGFMIGNAYLPGL